MSTEKSIFNKNQLPQMKLIETKAKPFLKWAGGKAQLIDQIAARLPEELRSGKIRKYVEPFVGGGALFFHIAHTFDIDEFFVLDRACS